MQIRHLYVRNFRGFKIREFNFSEQFNVLIGENGTGKTAILDALAIGAGSLFLGFDEVSSRNIHDDDVLRVSYEREIVTIEKQYPVLIRCTGTVDNQTIIWSRGLTSSKGRTTRQKATRIQTIATRLQKGVRIGSDDVVLPLIAYYGTGRLWLQRKESSVSTMKPGSRLSAYADCLSPLSNQKKLVRWFKTMEIASLQSGQELNTLTGVKTAISNCMEDWQTVEFNVQEDELIAKHRDGHKLYFRLLSDGVRNMLAMTADIAYRAATLNPQFGREAASETPGIVLIDEIDLHLHPKWQRRVVEDLRRTFPKIQFIATTHSEHIIQSLREGELIDLNSEDNVPSAEYEGKSLEDISEHVMGVDLPQQSERWKKMMQVAEEYYRILQDAQNVDSNRVNELKIKLDELTLPFSDDPAYQAFLKLEREAAGLGSQV
jgi:predicted ATP-binding protein involved in virulence